MTLKSLFRAAGAACVLGSFAAFGMGSPEIAPDLFVDVCGYRYVTLTADVLSLGDAESGRLVCEVFASDDPTHATVLASVESVVTETGSNTFTVAGLASAGEYVAVCTLHAGSASSESAESAFVTKSTTALATGGILSKVGTDAVHTFAESGTFSAPMSIQAARILVVGGGGAGGNMMGGGWRRRWRLSRNAVRRAGSR